MRCKHNSLSNVIAIMMLLLFLPPITLIHCVGLQENFNAIRVYTAKSKKINDREIVKSILIP